MELQVRSVSPKLKWNARSVSPSILLVAASFPTFLIYIGLAGSFKGHGGVIDCRGVNITGSQDGYRVTPFPLMQLMELGSLRGHLADGGHLYQAV